MSLCKTCQKTLPTFPASESTEESIAGTSKIALKRGDWQRSQRFHEFWSLKQTLLWHTAWESLVESLNHDCPICWILWRDIRASPTASFNKERITGFKAEIIETYYSTFWSRYQINICLMGHRLERKNMSLSFWKTTKEIYLEAAKRFPLTGKHTPKSAADVANYWIKTCESKHPKCLEQAAPPDHVKMPTRLIDLGDVDSKVWRLYQDPKHVPYAALTHRWSRETIRLRTSDVEKYRKPQPDSALPENYRDIISICRAIPIRYLWIDSLCIIQDDGGSEFRAEAPLMMNIYQYAFLTLSICWDNQGHSVFRQCRPQSIPRRLPLDLLSGRGYFSESDGWVFAETDRSELLIHVGGAPINQRGWVLQERCLSRRLLYLGNEQLYWECDGCTGSEVSPGRITNGGGRESILALTGADREVKWSSTLKQYTGSDLTYESDRLIAIAGLAKLIAGRTGETYFAGIWRESWMQCLLWEPVKKIARSPLSKPGEVAIAPPSWSWLGFSGSVVSTCGYGPKISYVEPNSFKSNDYQPLALLSQAQIIPSTSDPFSSIEGASLKIRCLLLPVKFTGIPKGKDKPCFFRHDPDIESSSVGIECFRLQPCEELDKTCVTYRLSFSQPVDADITVRYFLVPLYLRQAKPESYSITSCCYGLVLKEFLRGGTRQFMRVGIWRDRLQTDDHSSQLSPIISNTIVKRGIGKNIAVNDGSLAENERDFDSKLGEYAADHVDSKVQFPMKVVKMESEHQQQVGGGNEKSGIPGSEAAEQKVNQAVEEEGPIIRDEEVECSLLPHFTTAEWDTITLV